MKVEERVLLALEHHRGSFISGGELARQMEVSRNAIWKAIQSLQKKGYPIISQKKGYCLETSCQIMSKQSIEKYIKCSEINLKVFDQVTSTNVLLKEQAELGVSEGLCYVANEQTMGKGRRGRTFLSPAGTGIYTSILLRPKLKIKDALLITTMAAVATALAIEEVVHKKIDIKWVNDLYCDNKKICGILSEAALDMETGSLSYVILGIGINISTTVDKFDEETAKVAGSVLDPVSLKEYPDDLRSQIAAGVWNHFWELYETINSLDRSETVHKKKQIYNAYKERMMWLGKEIDLVDGLGNKEPVYLSDLNEDYSLKVQRKDHSLFSVSSGEISIRIKES